MGKLKLITRGIIQENPIFVLVLGMCPTLGTTTSAINGMGMGLATTFVLILSNMVISMIAGQIPGKVRIPSYIVVIASLVTILQMLMQVLVPSLYETLGLFIPLIVVNCIVLGRAEAFASKNSVLDSACDGLGTGLGFTLSLTVLGLVREILGSGSAFGWKFIEGSITTDIIRLTEISRSITAVGSGTIRSPMMKITRNASTRSPKRLIAVVIFISLPSISKFPSCFQQRGAVMFKHLGIREQTFEFPRRARRGFSSARAQRFQRASRRPSEAVRRPQVGAVAGYQRAHYLADDALPLRKDVRQRLAYGRGSRQQLLLPFAARCPVFAGRVLRHRDSGIEADRLCRPSRLHAPSLPVWFSAERKSSAIAFSILPTVTSSGPSLTAKTACTGSPSRAVRTVNAFRRSGSAAERSSFTASGPSAVATDTESARPPAAYSRWNCAEFSKRTAATPSSLNASFGSPIPLANSPTAFRIHPGTSTMLCTSFRDFLSVLKRDKTVEMFLRRLHQMHAVVFRSEKPRRKLTEHRDDFAAEIHLRGQP